MNCPFCATGQAGLDRNLSTAEIVHQIVDGMRALRDGEVPGGPGPAVQHRLHGHGRAARQLQPGRRRHPPAHRPRAGRPRAVAARHHRLDRRPGPGDASGSPTRASSAGSRSRCTRPTTSCATPSCRSTRAGRCARSSTPAWEYAERSGRRISIEYALIRDINDQAWRGDLLGPAAQGQARARQPDPAEPDARARSGPPRGPRTRRRSSRRIAGARGAGDRAGHPRPGDRRRLRTARRRRALIRSW